MSTPKDPTDAPFIPPVGGLEPDPSEDDSALALGASEEEEQDPIAMAQGLVEEVRHKATIHLPNPGGFPDDGDVDAWEEVSEDEARAVAARIADRAKEKAAQAQVRIKVPAASAKPAEEDPRALAKRLAAEAKKKAEASKPAEDPRALAKRLAAEAKKKAEASKPAEDPRALAKRLAEEAKKKAGVSAKPKKAKPQASKPKKAKPAEEPKDLMSRMGKPRSKRKSAADILAEARAAEEAKSQADAQAKEKAALAKKLVAEAKKKAAEQPPPSTNAAPPLSEVAPGLAVQDVLPGASVIQIKHPSNTDVLKAVWGAHLARAQASTDLSLAVASSSIIGALDRVGAEGIVALELRYAGSEHAVFLETATGALIAAISPAHVYLAGT